MERKHVPESPTRPALRLQATTTPASAAPSLSPSLKLDEGYSDETRSQSDKDLASDNAMLLPDWARAQSETDRAGKYFSPRLLLAAQNLEPQPPLSDPSAYQGNHLIFRTRIQLALISIRTNARQHG